MGMTKSRRGTRVTATLLAAIVFIFALICLQQNVQAADTAGNAENGVVRILGIHLDSDGNIESSWTGSAFGVGKKGKTTDTFVTNAHVATGGFEYSAEDPDVQLYVMLEDGAVYASDDGYWRLDSTKLVSCSVLYSTEGYPDVAVVRTDTVVPGRIALAFRKSKEAERKDTVYSIGYPASANDVHSLNELVADVDKSTINKGIISSFTESELAADTWVIEHTAEIDNGNSGGPLVDEDGYVIGINTYGWQTDTTSEEYYLSIFSDYAMEALDKIDVDYDVYSFPLIPIIIGIAGAAVIIILVVILVFRKKNGRHYRDDKIPGQYLRLEGVAGVFAGKRFSVEGQLRIGKLEDRNDLIYPREAQQISRVHCRLFIEDGHLYIQDLGSTYGTFLNGHKLPEGQKVELRLNDRVSLASDAEVFQIKKATAIS